MSTCQQMADYFAWQVMTGRGQHTARLDARGLREALDRLPPGETALDFVFPDAEEMFDEKHKVVFISARIVECGHE